MLSVSGDPLLTGGVGEWGLGGWGAVDAAADVGTGADTGVYPCHRRSSLGMACGVGRVGAAGLGAAGVCTGAVGMACGVGGVGAAVAGAAGVGAGAACCGGVAAGCGGVGTGALGTGTSFLPSTTAISLRSCHIAVVSGSGIWSTGC